MLISCYRLIENKILNGGVEIPSDKNLYCLKIEGDILFLQFEVDNDDSIIFWANLADVVYVDECEKEIDMSMIELYDGKYFNLI